MIEHSPKILASEEKATTTICCGLYCVQNNEPAVFTCDLVSECLELKEKNCECVIRPEVTLFG